MNLLRPHLSLLVALLAFSTQTAGQEPSTTARGGAEFPAFKRRTAGLNPLPESDEAGPQQCVYLAATQSDLGLSVLVSRQRRHDAGREQLLGRD